jgi:glycosyltransferase involved in cell wall biosynthesis
MEIMVSIICPIYNEERFIDACIRSVLAQDFPKENWELLLVDGGSTDRTRALIEPYLERYANIRLLNNDHRTAPYAMNIGIRAAKGEYICRIDAHSTFPTNYVSTLLRYISELPDATNVGGVCQTLPANDSRKAQAISIACSHPLGVGNSTFRTATIDKPTEADTVPFGFWHRSLFDEIGFFDEELTRNQDDEFNARTIQHGGHIYLVPGICTTYYARDTIAKTGRMFYQYGLFKPLVNKKINHPATIRQFVPLLFVLGIIIGLPLAFVHSVLGILYICGISLYLLAVIGIGIKYRNLYLPLVFATIHFSYGWGYLCGIGKLLFKRPFNVETNR